MRTNFLTPEQYLEIERKAEFKSEYYQGEMFEIPGATLPHNQISVNITSVLHSQLRSTRCHVVGSNMRLHVPATGLYPYPDAVVYCGEAQLQRPTIAAASSNTIRPSGASRHTS